jgi:hypothetical protein
MVESPQLLFNIVVMVAFGAVGLYTKSLKDKNDDRKADHERLAHEMRTLSQTVTLMRESIPQKYATIEDLNATAERIERANREADERQDRTNERMFKTLERIEGKLDRRARAHD